MFTGTLLMFLLNPFLISNFDQVNWEYNSGQLRGFDSLNVEFMGNWPFGSCEELAFDSARSLIFLGSGGGVYVLDISNPNSPAVLSDKIQTRGFINDIDFDDQNQLLYIALTDYGLDIWDVSDINQPDLVSNSFNSHDVYSIWVEDNLAYMGDESALRILDVSDPAIPTEIASSSQVNNAREIIKKDSILLTYSQWSNYLETYNVSDSTTIQFLDSYNCHWWGIINDISVADDIVTVALDSVGLEFVDISNPGDLQQISVFYHCDLNPCCEIFLNKVLYSSNYSGQLLIIDFSDPSSPVAVDSIADDGCAKEILLTDSVMCLSYNSANYPYGDYEGFKIIHPGENTNLQFLGLLNLPGPVRGCYILNDIAFLACRGLSIVDISNLSDPNQLSFISIDKTMSNLKVQGNYAFLTCYSDGLYVVDISDYYNPSVVGSLWTPSSVYDIEVVDSLAYIAGYGDGIYLVDISDPTKPVILGNLGSVGYPIELCIEDSLLCLVDYSGGFRIIDISNLYNPNQICFYDVSGNGAGIDINGDILYFLSRQYGVFCYDITDPMYPFPLDSIIDSYWSKIRYCNNYLYGIENGGVLHVIDVSDSSNIFEEGYYQTLETSFQIFADQNLAYIANGECGLQVYHLLGLTSVQEQPITDHQNSIILSHTLISRNQILTISNLPGSGKIQIFTIDGRNLWSKNYFSPQVTVNLSEIYRNIPFGFYFIYITDQSGMVIYQNKFAIID